MLVQCLACGKLALIVSSNRDQFVVIRERDERGMLHVMGVVHAGVCVDRLRAQIAEAHGADLGPLETLFYDRASPHGRPVGGSRRDRRRRGGARGD